MNIVKSLSRGFLALLFKFSLVLFLILWPIVSVFGTSDQLKASLKSSKIYDKAVDGIIEGVNKDASQNNGENPFKDPGVQQAAKSALSPSFLEKSSESIIDGIYNWLSKKTDRPEFTIDASGVKDQFAKAAGDYAVNRAKSLPACSVAQLRQMGTNVDPFSAECLPPGYNIEGLRDLVTQELNKPSENGEQNILQQPTITADNLPKDENGKTLVQNITEEGEQARDIYVWATRAPLIAAGLAVISGGLLVLLYDDKRRGIRNLAITLVPVGVLGLLGVFITKQIFAQLQKSDSLVNADSNIKEPLITLVQTLSSAVNQKMLLVAIIYTVLGAGTLIALHYTKASEPKTPSPEDLPLKEKPEESDAKTEEPKPEQK